MQVETKKKRTSFSYNVEGEKLKLIDISSEDDFLIASPLFDSLDDLRLSVTWDDSKEKQGSKISGIGDSSRTNAAEELFQKPSSMESGRPSYLRKSLAWDKAFFTNAGVLDADELSFINNGACQPAESQRDVRPRRPECSSDSHNFSVNTTKSAEVSKRDPINNQRLERSKTKISRDCNLQSLKPPKVLTTKTKNASSGQSKTASMGACHAKMPDLKTTRTAQALLAQKKSASGSFRFSSVSSSVSSLPRRDAISIDKSKRASSTTLLKNQPGSRKSKLSTSVSASLETTHLKNLSFSKEIFITNQPQQYKSPPANSTKAADTINGTPKGSALSSLQSPRFISQETVSTPSQLGEQGGAAFSGNSKPSSLRLPSPKIGFFDEVMPKAKEVFKFQIGKSSKWCADEGKSAGKSLNSQPAKTPITGNGKLKQVSTPNHLRRSASLRLPSSSPFSGANKHSGCQQLFEKSVECDREVFCKSRKLGAGEHERRSVDVKRGVVKARKKRVGLGESSSTKKEVNDLRRRLELIDLWDDLKIDCIAEKSPERKAANSSPFAAQEKKISPFCTRTPLADKNGLCNLGSPVDSSKKEKLIEKTLIFPSSQTTHKENI